MNKGFQLLKDIVGWFFGVIFLIIALGLLSEGVVFGAIATWLFGVGITPVRRMILKETKAKISTKVIYIVLTCLFLVSCGSLVSVSSNGDSGAAEENVQGVMSVQETEPEGIQEESNIVIIDTVGEKSEEESKENIEPKEIGVKEEDSAEETDIALETDLSMQIHFIDVGQGDATLIVSGEHAMLIDAGDDTKGTAVQLYLQKQGIEKLDYLVLTHTDEDHIGGADVIVSKFDIANVFMGDFPKESNVYRDLIRALENRNQSFSVPAVGENYAVGDAIFTILAPNREYSDPNNASIALVLQHGENRFLFSGDAQEQAEEDILNNGLNIACDVFKVGHHGSKYSNSKAFLDAMSPTYAVISCEENNSYGHPHAEVMNNLRSMGIKVFRTDEQGAIVATSDGVEITWNCPPSETWKAGENTQNSTEAEETVPEETIPEETIPEEGETSGEAGGGAYAVNSKNGKIHIVGACTATGTGSNAMTSPVYFHTYEEAWAYSVQIAPGEDKRECGNCYK